MSMANLDLEQLGRGVVAFFMFVVPAFAALGIFHWIDSRNQVRKSKPKQPEEDFFFGAVKDWRDI